MNVEEGIKIGDLSAIARRRVRAVVGVSLVVSLAGYWITMALPNEYESYATVLVEPQSVDRRLVEAGVPESDLNQRLGIMTANILSRSRLSRIIDDFELYQKESEDMVREEIIDLMRDKVSVEAVIPELAVGTRRNQDVEINTFKITFSDRNDRVAQKVAERLSNDFIEEHIEARVEISGKSLDFIQGELDRLSKDIREVEASVAHVKEENPGRLPEDVPNNQRRLERITGDLAFAQRAYTEARSDEAFFRAQAATAAVMAPGNDQSPGKRLQTLELALTDFRARGFTDKHPNIIKTKAEIAATRERLASVDPNDPAGGQSFMQHNADAEEKRAAQRRLAAEEEIERLENQAAEVQDLMIGTPSVAEQLEALSRRYQHQFGSYQDFSNRRLEATVQAQLERRQLGEQFRVLEAAFIAPEATSPNRPVLFVLSVLFGIGVGAAAGVLLEAMDSSIHDARQLQGTVRIPVLAAIPQILLESDRRALRRRRIRTAFATMAMVVFALLGGVASYLWVNGNAGWVAKAFNDEPDRTAAIGVEG